MTLLFFPKGLEKKAAIAVDLLKPSYFPGNGIETAFLSRQAISNGQKKNKGPLSLQIDFSPIMVSFLGEKIPEEKFIGTYLEKNKITIM